jgi:DNA-binding NtrC family response regulator
MKPKPPDVLVLGSEWPERALLRAQLIEEGYEVVAVDEWPIPRQYRPPRMKPHAVVVDLRGLANPRDVLATLPQIVEPDRVVVVTALGTIPADTIRKLGYHVLTRPARVGDVVNTISRLLRRSARD